MDQTIVHSSDGKSEDRSRARRMRRLRLREIMLSCLLPRKLHGNFSALIHCCGKLVMRVQRNIGGAQRTQLHEVSFEMRAASKIMHLDPHLPRFE